MRRWISIAGIALIFMGFGFSEFYRRKATRLEEELRSLQEVSARETLASSDREVKPAAFLGQTAPTVGSNAASAAPTAVPKTAILARRTNSEDPMDLVQALERTTDESERQQMIDQLLQDPSPAVRLAGAAALLKLSPEKGVAAVRSLVTGLDPNARTHSWGTAERAILALAEVEGNRASGDLYDYFESDQRMLRIPAARALELRGDPSPVQALVRELSRSATDRNQEETARIRALTDLGRTRSPTAIPTLASALADSNSSVRLHAVRSLETIDAIDSVLVLEKVLQDPSPNVRDAAQRAIEGLRQRLHM